MFRIAIGFILGAAVMFYALPMIEKNFGKIPRPDLVKWMGDSHKSSTEHPSNIINSEKPKQQTDITTLKERVMNAIRSTKTETSSNLASDSVVNVLSELGQKDSRIMPYINQRAGEGITNREALEIISAFISFDKP